MFEQSRRLSEPLRWTRREKLATAVVAVCALLALVGVGVYALASSTPARKDCIGVTFASTLGAAELHGCGRQARNICASTASFPSIRQQLREACRRAGFPVDSD